MIALTLLIWGVAGCLLAVLFLLIQQWTIRRIDPQQVKRSKGLVIGGTVLRWFLFSLLIFFTLRNTYTATFITFITFMITRTLLLFLVSRFPLVWQENNRLN